MSETFARDFEQLSKRFPAQQTFGNTAELKLFHAPNSICSQKVRAVLFQKKRPFVSHVLNIFKGETYEPVYVKSRLSGCVDAGLELATSHGEGGVGSTSATKTGCDACVVPTLANPASQTFMVDSQRICFELDSTDPNTPGELVPGEHATAISKHISIVDNFPNYQFLAIHAVGGRKKGEPSSNSFAQSKVERCESLMVSNKHNPDLVRAYSAKREKELLAGSQLFSDERMQSAKDQMESSLDYLESELSTENEHFLFGEKISLADIFWGIELIRLADLGLEKFWTDGMRPLTAAYYKALCLEDCLRSAVINWPGARLQKS